jgi:hypothetical protein
MAKNTGATRRDSGVAKKLGSAAFRGGGGSKTIGKVVASLAAKPITSNFLRKNGSLNAAPKKKSSGGKGKG